MPRRKKKILTVFGTRPEAIKMAPVIKALKKSKAFQVDVCITAQHRQMLDQVLKIFKIKPDYDLNIMRRNQDLSFITSRIILGMKSIMLESRPDLVLVQGDTTTTFASSLAAFYNRIPVGHIEAGLRTHDKYAPYPEEVNRCMTSAIADFHFAPTKWAGENLKKEKISPKKIFITGNTVVDALQGIMRSIKPGKVEKELAAFLPSFKYDRKIVLITGHRRESFGEGFKQICSAIYKLAVMFPEIDFVYPVHLNPNVRRPVDRILNKQKLSNVYLIEPLDYLPFTYLMSKSYIILTDSGGVQEEGISFGKPILVMRKTTERPEGILSGAAKLVSNNEKKIISECRSLLLDKKKYRDMVKKRNPYGDGKAAQRIVNILCRSL